MLSGIVIKDYAMISHINYGSVHSLLRGGVLDCPQRPELHGKAFRSFVNTEHLADGGVRTVDQVYYIDGDEERFESVEELVVHYKKSERNDGY